VVSTDVKHRRLPADIENKRVYWSLAIGVALIGALAALEWRYGMPVGTTVASATGVLAVVGALAVGIERVIEGFWTIVDAVASNPHNPFYIDAKRLDAFTTQIASDVQKPLDGLSKALAAANDEAVKTRTEKSDVQKQVDGLLASVNLIVNNQHNPKSWPALGALQAGLADLSSALDNADLQKYAQTALAGLGDLSSFAASLTENPGRKTLSLMAGCLVGLGVTWVLGLDAIHAALGSPNGTTWGMVATGLAVGLGANPTHELIGVLQNYKQNTSPSKTPAPNPGS